MNKGIVRKRLATNQMYNSVETMARGGLVLTAIYMSTHFFGRSGTVETLDRQIILLPIICILAQAVVFTLKNRYENKQLKDELFFDFKLNNDEDLRELDEKVTYQMKNHKLFTTNANRVMGTKDYVVIDFDVRNFHVLPVKGLKSIEVDNSTRGASVLLNYKRSIKQVFFRSAKDARDFLDHIEGTYL